MPTISAHRKVKGNVATKGGSKSSTDSDGNRDCETEIKKTLVIEIYTYDMEDIFEQIGFNEEQQEWARRLVTSGAIQEQFRDLAQELRCKLE